MNSRPLWSFVRKVIGSSASQRPVVFHRSLGVRTGISISWHPILSISSRMICSTFCDTRNPSGSQVYRPDASGRAIAARSMSRWPGVCASAGASRKVRPKSVDCLMKSTPRVVFGRARLSPAPERRRLARDSVRGPSRTHRPNSTRRARSDVLEQLPDASLHAVGHLHARRPATRDDDILIAPACLEGREHHQRRRALALVPLLDLRTRLSEAAMKALDPNVQLVLWEALASHVDARDEGDVVQLGVAEVVAMELVEPSWRIE